MHVDDFIYSFDADPYASWFFHFARLPAVLKAKFAPFFNANLFCDYEGKRYRVTGASRLGDVWLARNLDQDDGYDLRVDVEGCSNWGADK
jgi:hypothetical protein